MSTDLIWPPPESELDAIEVIDLDHASPVSLSGIRAVAGDRRAVSASFEAATIVDDFDWPPPADDFARSIVILDATADADSPWFGSHDELRSAPAALVARRARFAAVPPWLRAAAAVVLCVGGTLLIAPHLPDGIERTTTVVPHAPWRGDAVVVSEAASVAPSATPARPVAEARPTPKAVEPEVEPVPVLASASHAVHVPVAAPAAPAVDAPRVSVPAPLLVAAAPSVAAPSLDLAALKAAAPAAPAAATSVPHDEARIEATLARYRTAYQSLDAAMARSVWPSVDARALERAFGSLKSQGLAFDGCKTDVQGPDATVACRGRATYVPRIGSQRPRTEEHQWRFRMRKIDESWLIVSADAQ